MTLSNLILLACLTVGADYRITIPSSHIDYTNHVNNAHYLEYLQDARWNWLANRGMSRQTLEGMGYHLVVTHLHIAYDKPLREGDNLRVETYLHVLENKYFTLHHTGYTKQRVFVAEVKLMIIDNSTGHPIEFDRDMRKLLNPDF